MLKYIAIIAAAIVVLGGLGMSRWSKWKRLQKEGQTHQTPARNHHQPAQHHREKRAAGESPVVKPDSSPTQHQAKEWDFWDRQIQAARNLNRVTAAGAVVAIAALVVLILSLRESKNATVEANRAWIAPEAPRFTYAPKRNQVVDMVIPFDNIGGGLATDIRFGTKFDTVPMPPNGDATQMEQLPDNLCPYLTMTLHFGAMFKTAFQNEIGFMKEISKDSYADSIPWNDDLANGRQFVRVKGCISYMTFKKRHHTSFCFVFDKNLENQPGIKIGSGCNGGDWAD